LQCTWTFTLPIKQNGFDSFVSNYQGALVRSFVLHQVFEDAVGRNSSPQGVAQGKQGQGSMANPTMKVSSGMQSTFGSRLGYCGQPNHKNMSRTHRSAANI
jgi:hypothetical protein